jgi:hypothetical protein
MTRSRDIADQQENLGGAVAPFVAGKNKIINGDFAISQRGTTFTNPNAVYTLDRWIIVADGGSWTKTVTQETFTPGTAPVAGYEGSKFIRINQSVAGSAGNYNVLYQHIEDVRSFAGQKVVLSFWAKASSSISMRLAPSSYQYFGSGGSSPVATDYSGSAPALTTSWQRFTATATIPSIAGKTIGTNSSLTVEFQLPVNTTFSIDIWGVQLEAGSVASPFTTASGGTIGGELALCQRYYHRFNFNSGSYSRAGVGTASSTTNGKIFIPFNTTMRTTPTAVDYSTLGLFDGVNTYVITSVALDQLGPENGTVDCAVASGLTQYRPYFLYYGNTTGAYIGFSAEL